LLKHLWVTLSALFFISPSYSIETVPFVDLERYLGTWYEIASYPAFFQKGCVATKATYSLRTDGRIDVLNECRKNSLTGPIKTAKGVATVMDEETNAKLKVRFFIFSGDYWIIDLDKDYAWAVVSNPSQRYLWILSREKKLEESLLNGILQRLKENHFDLTKLQMTPQG